MTLSTMILVGGLGLFGVLAIVALCVVVGGFWYDGWKAIQKARDDRMGE